MTPLAHSARPERGIPQQAYSEHIGNVVRQASEAAKAAARFCPTGGALLEAAVELAAEFHDLGKLDEQNQGVLADGRGRLRLNHVDAGVAQAYSEKIDPVRQLAAILIYSHHAGLPAILSEEARGAGNAFRDPEPTSARIPLKAHIDQHLPEYVRTHRSVVTECSTERGPVPKAPVSPLFMRLALSCLVDADHSDTARHYGDPVAASAPLLQPDRRLRLLSRYVDQLAAKKDDSRTKLRSALYQCCRDADSPAAMLACDGPVGSGKTTAVMSHLLRQASAKELRRVIVVLPFTNIIDQSVDVYRRALVAPDEGADDVVAAHHHKAEFDDPSARQFAYLWHAPVVVTTAVQFFETLAARSPAALRKLHQVPGSAIFIDESHTALPAQLWPQAWKWLRELEQDWCCHIVLGSGSLNRLWELKEFVDPPAVLPNLVSEPLQIAAANLEGRRIRYRSNLAPLDLDALEAFLIRQPAPRLVIVNTVQSAAAIARHLAERLGGEHVEHLSTALTPRDRKATLDLVRLRLKQLNHRNWTLVATSCVEAGVDISFRTALRERCSLTSLLQTAGRVNRSNEYDDEKETPTVWDIQLRHDHLLRPHPAFEESARVLSQLFDENHVSPDYCTEALRREVRQGGMKKVHQEILTAERSADFPKVESLFRVIASDTVTAVADPALIGALERGEKVTRDEIQSGSVQIWQSREMEWNLGEIGYFKEMKKWTLTYNSFLGYMAGVLPLIDADVMHCTIV